jgi:hypothetical protein
LTFLYYSVGGRGNFEEEILPDDSRAGFFIGYGTGVGKGRMIAGLIFTNRQKKRKRTI